MANRLGTSENSERRYYYYYYFLSSKITADGDCSQEIKRCLLLGRKVMANLESILQSRDITLPTKVILVKAIVFLVIMYVFEFSSVQFSRSVVSNLCNLLNHSTPGFPVRHYLMEFTQTHVHSVSDAIQPSHPLSSPSHPALNPSHHQSLFQ